MRGRTLLAILLLAVGCLSLAYQGITYTRREKVLDLGNLEATAEKSHTIPIPPLAGAVALVAGALLLPWRRADDNA
jgi:hypothetical protein